MFDPALPLGGPVARGQLPAMRRLVRQGRNDEAFRRFLEVMPRSDVSALAKDPDFRRQVSLMPNALRELEAIDALSRDPRAYATIAAPSWLITGEKSPDHPFRDTSRALARVLPRAHVRELKGQGPTGMAAAPDALAALLARCLTEPA
jgi:pimeloyl-ACP methyl ester carboxylesterase